MLSLHEKRKLDFIPEEFEAELTEEIMEAYKVAATGVTIVCLDIHIVQQMSFQLLRILYFHELGSIIDVALLDDPEEWRFLHERYPAADNAKEIIMFRSDVKRILLEHQMMFEENWLFSAAPDYDHPHIIHNSPIQSVW